MPYCFNVQECKRIRVIVDTDAACEADAACHCDEPCECSETEACCCDCPSDEPVVADPIYRTDEPVPETEDDTDK